MDLTAIQAAIDQINASIAGVAVLQSMTFGDQTFVFTSMDDRLKALAYLNGLLQAGSGSPQTYRLAATSKGT